MSPRFAHNAADLGSKDCLPEQLKKLLDDTLQRLAKAGGEAYVSKLDKQVHATLTEYQSAGTFSAEDIDLVLRLLDVAIERKRGEFFPE